MAYEMTIHSLPIYLILTLVVGYSQLVASRASKLGTDSSRPGKSCRDIYDYNTASRRQSGYYWIKADQVRTVYCDMELTCGGIRGGWMRIVILILLKEMIAPVDGARLYNQGHYVEDQEMVLDAILLISLITGLNIILFVENYVDIKKELMVALLELIVLLHAL